MMAAKTVGKTVEWKVEHLVVQMADMLVCCSVVQKAGLKVAYWAGRLVEHLVVRWAASWVVQTVVSMAV